MLRMCPAVLSWQDSKLLHLSLLSSHRDFLSVRFGHVVADFIRAGVGDRLSRLSNALPADALDRLVTAPDSAWRLVYGEKTDLVFFMNSAQAEHCRIQGDSPAQRGIWTALGDHYYPAGPPRSENFSSGHRPEWEAESEFDAPRLSNGIIIDYTSSHADRFLRLTKLPRGSIRPSKFSEISHKIEDALALVGSVSPQAHELISSHTRSILVWNDPAQHGEHFSLSTPRWPGRIGFSNVEYGHTDIAALADSMIHESIHAFFHHMEEITPFLNTDPFTLRETVSSPWSGRTLQIHSFLHACYVWFGLWQFWLRASSCGAAVPGTRIQQLIDRSRTGFFSPTMDAALTATAPYLSAEGHSIFAFVQDVQDGVYG